MHTYKRNYVHFVSGKKSRLFSENGDEYIDFTSGIGVASLGHGNKTLAKAINSQAKKLIHTSNLFLIEPQALLAQKIVGLSGYDMRVFFGNSGAEANEAAIKIARKYGSQNNKYKIITLDNSFHGRTISSLKATGQPSMHKTYFSPYPDGFVYAKDLDDVKNALDDQTAAVMIELVQGEGGVKALDKQKVQELAVLLKQKDVLLIVDEVQTGVYRTGEFLASNYYQISPDIITIAKGIASGLPMGLVMTNKKDIFAYSDHGSTFGGNFLCSYAGLTTLEILENLYSSGKLAQKIQLFEQNLKEILLTFSNIFKSVHGIGLMRGLECDEALQEKIVQEAFKQKLLVLKSGNNRIRFLPPLIITKKEIKIGFRRLYEACKNI